MDEELLLELHETLGGVEVIGEWEEFKSYIKKDPNNLKNLYKEYGDEIGGTEQEFMKLMTSGKPKKEEKDSQAKIDSRIKNVNKVYEEQVGKIDSGQWDDDQKIELKKRVIATRDEQIGKLNKEKDIDVYSQQLIDISSSVPENIQELSIELSEEDYGSYLKYAEDLLKSTDSTLEYTEQQIADKAKELYVIKEFRKEEAHKALEKFETEFGINRTESFKDVLDTAMDYAWGKDVGSSFFNIAKGLYNDYTEGKLDNIGDEWSKDKWGLVTELSSRYLGTEKEKEYKKNREELHRQLVVKNKKLDTDYRDKVGELLVLKSKADKDYEDFEKIEKRLKQKDSTVTTEEYNEYVSLFTYH